MKRHNLISSLVLLSGLFLVTVLASSCGKDGVDGADGATGATGATGPKGDAGTAVIYSGWLDVPYKPDTVHLAGGGIDTVGYFATIDAPKLTLALLGTADVKVYINTDVAGDPFIYPLPYSGISGVTIEVAAYEQKIQLYANVDVSTFTRNGSKYNQYRYMIVPGNTGARSASVNWSDYKAVKAYLGLND